VVGRREPGKDTVFYGGGKLAADLSLPKLQARGAAAGGVTAPAWGPSVPEQDRAQLWKQAAQAAAHAAEQVRPRADSSDADGMAGAGDAAAAAEVLPAATRLIEGEGSGPHRTSLQRFRRSRARPVCQLTVTSSCAPSGRLRAWQSARRPRGRR